MRGELEAVRGEQARSATNGWAMAPTVSAGLRKIAVLGNHLPRQCGIATFTADLSEAISTQCPALECFVLAMNEAGQRYAYPERVRFEISAPDVASYRRAADFLNVSPVDLVSVQHEYGIFGGKAGSHLLALLRELRMPVVTTLHTILAAPNSYQRAVMDELTSLSERLVVMSAHGAELLAHKDYSATQPSFDSAQKAISGFQTSHTLPTRSGPGFSVGLPGCQPEGVASPVARTC